MPNVAFWRFSDGPSRIGDVVKARESGPDGGMTAFRIHE
jgi:hypothetical protein